MNSFAWYCPSSQSDSFLEYCKLIDSDDVIGLNQNSMIAFILTKPNTRTIIDVPSLVTAEHLFVNDLLKNDLSSFNKLYKMYAPNLMGVIMKIVNQQETAEDLLQEVFLKIRKSLHTYDEKKSRLFTWMLNITRNTALDHLRKKSYRQDKANVILEDVGTELENHTFSMNTDVIGIKKLLEQLSSKQKLVLDLAYYQGYTHEEIAEKLDMPVGSVKTTLRQAIIKLRNIFGKC
ncbi:RNA polymerase sigma factor [Pedobacter sp. G11]|uniref:RNA polymerase sigma factor n=1 Tax=Pedobacter sp. G11 TaxID=2482728 RepID=UPI001FEFBA09|nr:RNA polymerase sigma factor [Pedobacter sp. G11]